MALTDPAVRDYLAKLWVVGTLGVGKLTKLEIRKTDLPRLIDALFSKPENTPQGKIGFFLCGLCGLYGKRTEYLRYDAQHMLEKLYGGSAKRPVRISREVSAVDAGTEATLLNNFVNALNIDPSQVVYQGDEEVDFKASQQAALEAQRAKMEKIEAQRRMVMEVEEEIQSHQESYSQAHSYLMTNSMHNTISRGSSQKSSHLPLIVENIPEFLDAPQYAAEEHEMLSEVRRTPLHDEDVPLMMMGMTGGMDEDERCEDIQEMQPPSVFVESPRSSTSAPIPSPPASSVRPKPQKIRPSKKPSTLCRTLIDKTLGIDESELEKRKTPASSSVLIEDHTGLPLPTWMSIGPQPDELFPFSLEITRLTKTERHCRSSEKMDSLSCFVEENNGAQKVDEENCTGQNILGDIMVQDTEEQEEYDDFGSRGVAQSAHSGVDGLLSQSYGYDPVERLRGIFESDALASPARLGDPSALHRRELESSHRGSSRRASLLSPGYNPLEEYERLSEDPMGHMLTDHHSTPLRNDLLLLDEGSHHGMSLRGTPSRHTPLEIVSQSLRPQRDSTLNYTVETYNFKRFLDGHLKNVRQLEHDRRQRQRDTLENEEPNVGPVQNVEAEIHQQPFYLHHVIPPSRTDNLTAARAFFHLLILATNGEISVHQDEPFGSIHITEGLPIFGTDDESTPQVGVSVKR